MMNLSSLCKAAIFAGAATALSAGAAALQILSGAGLADWSAALPALAVLTGIAGCWFVFAACKSVKLASTVCRRAAHGDLEARIIFSNDGGDVARLHDDINHLLDITDAFVREAGTSMHFVSQGKYFRPLLARGMPGNFRYAAETVTGATKQMSDKVREFKAFIAKTAAELETTVGGAIEAIASATAELHRNAESLTNAAKQTTSQSVAVAATSEEVSVSVQTVSAAAEELASSVAEIGRQVTQSAKIAETAALEAKRTNETVMGLVQAAAKIGEVVGLINDIASQTNLLALNATIEAARAGEAGKGFAVVASEVKSLANQTAKATEDIVAQITAIQSATDNAVGAIQSIGKTIGEINEISASIAGAVEEQGAATSEIARNVQQAAGATQEVSTNISGITQAAHHTGDAAGEVSAATGGLSREAETLRGEVAKFLEGLRAA